MFHVKHRKDAIMKLKELCLVCNNLNPFARVKVIITPGEEPYVGILDDIFDVIADRIVKWFIVRDDIIIIKLCEV